MRTIKLVSITLLGIVFLQIACTKNKIDEKRLLSDEMKSQNPYYENDKLYFVSDSAQEFVLQVSFRRNEILEYQSGNYATNYLIEIERTYIKSFDTTQQCSFWLQMEGYSRPHYEISFKPPVKNGMSAYFDLPLSKVSPQYVDSVYVNGKWHYGIFIEEKEKTGSDVYRLYYSIELGIIKIDFSDESTWELEKIE